MLLCVGWVGGGGGVWGGGWGVGVGGGVGGGWGVGGGGWVVGGWGWGWGWGWGFWTPLPPGFNPPTRPIFSSPCPRPPFFVRVPPPEIQIFAPPPPPPPAHMTPRPFFVKSPPTPNPRAPPPCPPDVILYQAFENYICTFKITATSPMGQHAGCTQFRWVLCIDLCAGSVAMKIYWHMCRRGRLKPEVENVWQALSVTPNILDHWRSICLTVTYLNAPVMQNELPVEFDPTDYNLKICCYMWQLQRCEISTRWH